MGRVPPAPRRQLGRFLSVRGGGGPPGWEWGTAREGPAGRRYCGRGWRTRYLPLLNYLTGHREAQSPTFHCPLHRANQRAKAAQVQRVPLSRAQVFREGAVCAVTLGVAPKPPLAHLRSKASQESVTLWQWVQEVHSLARGMWVPHLLVFHKRSLKKRCGSSY